MRFHFLHDRLPQSISVTVRISGMIQSERVVWQIFMGKPCQLSNIKCMGYWHKVNTPEYSFYIDVIIWACEKN